MRAVNIRQSRSLRIRAKRTRRGHHRCDAIDPERKPPERRSIRDIVGNSRPAIAPETATGSTRLRWLTAIPGW
jgi:hypothetical protein